MFPLPSVGFLLLWWSRSDAFILESSNPRRNELRAADPAVVFENLSCSHDGLTYQLDNVRYVLQKNSRVALIGRNGAGKSTLLQLLAAEAGYGTNVRYDGKIAVNSRVAFVPQEPPELDITVRQALLGVGNSFSNQQLDVVRRYQLAMDTSESDPDDLAQATTDMDSVGGWDVLTKADEIATRLRIDSLYSRPMSVLSGGERKRVALAAALVLSPDVLLLDEPTNFLSLAGVQWLEDLLLMDTSLTILLVTHDRAFLDRVCDRILELDEGKLYEYQGRYADFLEAKEARLLLEDAAVQAAKTKYRTELAWMRRQPQARESKSKARIDAFYKLEKSTQPKVRPTTIELESEDRRIGGKILSLRNVSLMLGDKIILDDFSYDFIKGDRICVSGSNGCGKTTFVRLLTGELKPDRGTIELGDTISLGVYDQLGIDVEDPEQTVLGFVVECVRAADNVAFDTSPDEARRLLRRFEFPRSRWNDRISVLSGGERRRLQLLQVLSKRPNFLILDEPSVDLDIPTLQSLESYLGEFQGVLLVVSHDRYFADKVADHLFVFQGQGKILDYPGTLSEYASTLIEMEENKQKKDPSKRDDYKEEQARRNEQRNALRKAKKEMNSLERAIEKLKLRADDLQVEYDDSGDEGWSVLAEIAEQMNQVKEEMDVKEERWMELAELVEDGEKN